MKKSLLFLFSDLANKLLKNYPKQIYLLFTLCLSISFFSCENEPVGSSDPTTEVQDKLPYTTKSMSLKDVPEVESYVRSILSIKTNKSATSKSINDLEHGASFDIEKIVETIDSINNKNYSIRFVFDDTPENVFYNLVINFLPNGDKHAFVEKYTCSMENYLIYRNSRYNFNYFKGKVDLYYYTAFFGKKATAVLAKTTTTATPCQQAYYPNGDPIPTLSSFVGSGGTDTGSGGSTNTSIQILTIQTQVGLLLVDMDCLFLLQETIRVHQKAIAAVVEIVAYIGICLHKKMTILLKKQVMILVLQLYLLDLLGFRPNLKI